MTTREPRTPEIRFLVGDVSGPCDSETRTAAERILARSIGDRDDECIIAVQDDVVVGAIGVRIEAPCPTGCLGTLPAREAQVDGVGCAEGYPTLLPTLLRGAQARIGERHGLALQWTLNEANGPCDDHRRAAVESGMDLFQEKRGYAWDEEHLPELGPSKLAYRTIREVGEEAYRAVLMRCGENTLDRNDAWYRERAGPENWGRAFMGYYDPADADTWLLAFDESEHPVGFIAISAFDDQGTSTIIYIGVLPGRRGRGAVDDLLRRGAVAAREAGFIRMLSDADVFNRPMCEAFERNGHRADLRPWHKWHFRFGGEWRMS